MAKFNLGRVRGLDGAPGRDGERGLDGLQGVPGPQGPQGEPGSQPPISDSVTSLDSGVAASSAAVKTVWDKAVEALEKAAGIVLSWEKIIDKPEAFKPESHGHELGDISGVLPLEKGGTGVSTVTEIQALLGVTAGGGGFAKTWVSPLYGIASGTRIISTHNLNLATPINCIAIADFVCAVAEAGYSVGDVAQVSTIPVTSSSSSYIPIIPRCYNNTIEVTIGASAYMVHVGGKLNGSAFNITSANAKNWRIRFRIFY